MSAGKAKLIDKPEKNGMFRIYIKTVKIITNIKLCFLTTGVFVFFFYFYLSSDTIISRKK